MELLRHIYGLVDWPISSQYGAAVATETFVKDVYMGLDSVRSATCLSQDTRDWPAGPRTENTGIAQIPSACERVDNVRRGARPLPDIFGPHPSFRN